MQSQFCAFSRSMTALGFLISAGLLACVPETISLPDSSKPLFNHAFDPSAGTITVNQYHVTLKGNAVSSSYRGFDALYAGGVAYGTSASSVFLLNPTNGTTDFAGTGLPLDVVTDGSVGGAAHYTSELFLEHPNVALGPKVPLGIVTVRETYAYTDAANDDYVIVKYTLSNPTAASITGFYAGLLYDPDFVNVFVNVATADVANSAALVLATTSPLRHAVALLSGPIDGYRAWTNGGVLADPNTNAGWFSLVSTPMITTPVGPTDVRQYIRGAPTTLAPGANQVVAFALVGGDDNASLALNIAAARAKAASLLVPNPSLPITVSIQSSATIFTARLTFPTAALASGFVPAAAACGGAPIGSYTISGNHVDVSFALASLNDELRSGDRMYCTGHLNDHTYFIGSDTPAFDADLQPIELLTHFSGLDGTPSFSPDGTRLAFNSARNGGGIFVMDVAGGDATAVQLTTGTTDRNPSWSPDGTRIVFSRSNTTGPIFGGIFAVDVATLAVVRLTLNQIGSPGNKSDGDPHFSPNGSRIAFRRTLTGSGSPSGSHIWIMGSAGEIGQPPATALVRTGLSDLMPAWSSDGSTLYFASAGGSRPSTASRIYSIDVATGEPSVTLITSGNEDVQWNHPSMSPDGKTLATWSASLLVLQDILTGLHSVPHLDPLPVTFAVQDGVQNIEFSPDGTRLVFVADNDIWITNPKHIVTPIERAQSLESSIQTLIDDGLIGASEGSGLQDKLGNVTDLIVRGQLNAAINNVNAFLNKVAALVNSQRIGVITAELLTTNANALISQIAHL